MRKGLLVCGQAQSSCGTGKSFWHRWTLRWRGRCSKSKTSCLSCVGHARFRLRILGLKRCSTGSSQPHEPMESGLAFTHLAREALYRGQPRQTKIEQLRWRLSRTKVSRPRSMPATRLHPRANLSHQHTCISSNRLHCKAAEFMSRLRWRLLRAAPRCPRRFQSMWKPS